MWGILAKLFLVGGVALGIYVERLQVVAARAERDTASTKLEVANRSTLTAIAAAKTEHGVVQQLLGLAQARKEEGAKALAALSPREREDQATSDRLRASAATAHPADAPCVISRALAETKGL